MGQPISLLKTAIEGITPGVTLDQHDDLFQRKPKWENSASVAGTTAIAEHVFHRCERKCRLVGAKLVTDAAVAANGSNFWTLLVAKRLAATPFTSTNAITFATDTPTTDDLVAWGAKDLVANFTTTDVDLTFALGDIVTVAVTKTGASGLAFPAAVLQLFFEPLDA